MVTEITRDGTTSEEGHESSGDKLILIGIVLHFHHPTSLCQSSCSSASYCRAGGWSPFSRTHLLCGHVEDIIRHPLKLLDSHLEVHVNLKDRDCNFHLELSLEAPLH